LAQSLEVQTESKERQQNSPGHRQPMAKWTKRILLGTENPSTFRMN
jgi:hypothetical protein